MSIRPLGFQLTPEQAHLATQHLNLARSQAWRFQKKTEINYDDLESAAMVGLLKACAGFDESLGWKFSTYAVPKIRGELLHHVRDHSYLLRLTHRTRELWTKGRRMRDQGMSDTAIAEALGVKLSEWLESRAACSRAPLMLRDNAYIPSAPLEAVEEDRLTHLEGAIARAWEGIGGDMARALAAHFCLDHALKKVAADTFVSLAECLYLRRDVSFIGAAPVRKPAGVVRYEKPQDEALLESLQS